MRLRTQAFGVYLVLFGLWCGLVGWLILRSTFLPRIFGALSMLAGAAWMLHLAPPLARHLFPVIAGASALGEISLLLWLLVEGVDVTR